MPQESSKAVNHLLAVIPWIQERARGIIPVALRIRGTSAMTQQSECEYVILERCSLTGRGCFCDPARFLHCVRRMYALDYEQRQQARRLRKPTVVCSEDDPKPPLRGT